MADHRNAIYSFLLLLHKHKNKKTAKKNKKIKKNKKTADDKVVLTTVGEKLLKLGKDLEEFLWNGASTASENGDGIVAIFDVITKKLFSDEKWAKVSVCAAKTIIHITHLLHLFLLRPPPPSFAKTVVPRAVEATNCPSQRQGNALDVVPHPAVRLLLHVRRDGGPS